MNHHKKEVSFLQPCRFPRLEIGVQRPDFLEVPDGHAGGALEREKQYLRSESEISKFDLPKRRSMNLQARPVARARSAMASGRRRSSADSGRATRTSAPLHQKKKKKTAIEVLADSADPIENRRREIDYLAGLGRIPTARIHRRCRMRRR